MPIGNLFEVTELDSIESLREEWDDLLIRSGNPSIFQTFEWVSCCQTHFGKRKRLALVCVRQKGRLVGIAPMEIVKMYGLPLRRLQFIGTGVFDYLDFILDSKIEKEVADAIFGWLKDNERRWDLVDLQNLRQDTPFLNLLRTAQGENPRMDNWLHEIVKGEACPCLPLAESWDDMSLRFGKKMRSNLGYYERLIKRDFEEVEICTLGQQNLDEGMDAFFDLHTQRWRRRWLPGMLTGANRQQFHRDVAQLCLKKGWLQLHSLRLQGRIQSILYCFAFNKRSYYYLGGFDPQLSKYSLGTVLTGFAIRKAIEHGCTDFDFLRGNEPYKSRWTRESTTNHRFILNKKNPKSRLAAAICRLEQRIEHRVKHELHKRIGNG